jgi:hypothetical protein
LERGAKRQLAIESGSIVGKRKRRALDPSALAREQPRRQTDQARFAASIGTGNVQRFTGRDLKVEVFEQQPTSAPKRDGFEAKK